MRFAVPGLTLVAALGLAACANNPNRPTDTGNMATPTPQQSGVIGTTTPGLDTGSARPVPGASGQSTGLRPPQPDALGSQGSMQLPQSSQGTQRGRVQ